jgi:hypothetical protein
MPLPESIAGLPEVQEYRDYAGHRPSARHTTHHYDCGCMRDKADAAIVALEAELAKDEGMLRLMIQDDRDYANTGWPSKPYAEILADLRARYEKEET